jgi:hypothetical protein
MRLNLRFFPRPYPLRRGIDVSDNRLAALGDVDMLNGHLLLALRAVGRRRNAVGIDQEGLDGREGSGGWET